MCTPEVMLVATAFQAVGSIYSGFAQAKQLKRGAAIDEANADIADVNALNYLNAAAVNRGRVSRQGRRAGGSIRSGAAKSGVRIDEGSPLDAQIANAMNSMVNELDQLYKGEVGARGEEVKAFSFRSSAASKRSSAKSSIMGGFINAAGSVATGAYMGHQAGLFKSGAATGGGFLRQASAGGGNLIFSPINAGQPITRFGIQ